jgi:hypothetical protein
MNLSTIHSKADFIGSLNPKAWDALHPHVPFVLSNAFIELMVADVVKHAASAITDRALSKQVLGLSKKMANQAMSVMGASWEPGDEICPPWPWPWPGPWPFTKADPEPEPWKGVLSANQVEIAHVLIRLSGLTMSKEHNAELISVANSIVKGVAGRLAEDFERCGTVPRKPFPGPRKGPR